MKREHWETIKKAARLEKLDKIPMALIIDSPWIPGYVGVKHMDFFFDPEVWFQSHWKIHQEYPDIMFVPGWWWEYGMAAEPSVFGSKIKFWQTTRRANITCSLISRIWINSPSTRWSTTPSWR